MESSKNREALGQEEGCSGGLENVLKSGEAVLRAGLGSHGAHSGNFRSSTNHQHRKKGTCPEPTLHTAKPMGNSPVFHLCGRG
jgi:hypothetical protein